MKGMKTTEEENTQKGADWTEENAWCNIVCYNEKRSKRKKLKEQTLK